MKLLAIAGKAGSGKDTLAHYIKTILPPSSVRTAAFADPIKDGLSATIGIARSVFDDRALKEKPIAGIGKSPRELMQSLGTAWGRELVAEDLWVRRMEQFANSVEYDFALCQNIRHGDDGLLIITDVRMDNEAQWVREHGGKLVHLHRASAGSVAAHSSEAGVTFVTGDLAFDNSGSLRELSLFADVARRSAGEYKRYPGAAASAPIYTGSLAADSWMSLATVVGSNLFRVDGK